MHLAIRQILRKKEVRLQTEFLHQEKIQIKYHQIMFNN